MIDYTNQIFDILDSGLVHISDILPSHWAEENIVMAKPFPGPFRYSRTPYTREIIDCLSPDHPARWVAIMKGAQIGFSAGVIYPGVGWIIKNQPGNTLVSVGNPDLIEKTMEKIDLMIDSAGIRKLIRPSVQRNRAGKSGDTNLKKEFPNGYVTVGSANNHKAIRQVDLQYIFMDDFESIKKSSKESGSTRMLIEQRAAAYGDKMKIFYISTPELKQGSNIEPAYLLGDQRKFLIPCPCCGEFIEIVWAINVNEKETAGITWKLDTNNRLIPGSVGYICQKCSGFFTDSKKGALLNEGFWSPTAEPSKLGYYSYHISSLYAPAGMYDWKHYVYNYLEACPSAESRKEDLYKAHVNLCLGLTYEGEVEAIRANQLQKNIRNYEIGMLPEKLSISDGNGKIVLVTCASDLNGTIEDARLDYEVLGWSESGASYSIQQGSIGTFIPRENQNKNKVDRERWTYELNRPNSVWPVLDKILGTYYETDTGRRMKPFIAGVDCGNTYGNYPYNYIDKSNFNVIGLKGKDLDKYVRFEIDVPHFNVAKERSNLYLVQVGKIKDYIAESIKLRWDKNNEEIQPPGFMNFPIPSKGQYLFESFFEHYESEHRVIAEKDNGPIMFKWEKKTSTSQNHFFDVRVYNIAVRDILVAAVCKELKIKQFGWNDYVNAILGNK